MATVRQPTPAEENSISPAPAEEVEVAGRNGPLTGCAHLLDSPAPAVVTPPPAEKPKITQELIDARFEKLLRHVQANRPSEDVSLIRRAWEFCVQHHAGQERASGEPYIIHPLEVAEVLAEMKLDASAIAAGLLHDAVEDTPATNEEIAAELRRPGGAHCRRRHQDRQDPVCQPRRPPGRKRAQDAAGHGDRCSRGARSSWPTGCTTCAPWSTFSPNASEAHCARDPGHLCAARAPAGHGQSPWRTRGPRLSLYRPGSLRAVQAAVESAAQGRRTLPATKSNDTLQSKLQENNIRGARRVAHQAALLHLSEAPAAKVELDQVYDLLAVRVITERRQDCYAVFGLIHSLGGRCPGRIKDFIAIPRANLLPIAAHYGDRRARASSSKCRSAPKRCTASRKKASPRTGSTRTAARWPRPRRRALELDSPPGRVAAGDDRPRTSSSPP